MRGFEVGEWVKVIICVGGLQAIHSLSVEVPGV